MILSLTFWWGHVSCTENSMIYRKLQQKASKFLQSNQPFTKDRNRFSGVILWWNDRLSKIGDKSLIGRINFSITYLCDQHCLRDTFSSRLSCACKLDHETCHLELTCQIAIEFQANRSPGCLLPPQKLDPIETRRAQFARAENSSWISKIHKHYRSVCVILYTVEVR